MNAKDAAKQIVNRRFFKDLPSDEKKSIQQNIKKSGHVVGSGHGAAMIHTLTSRARKPALELILKEGADINARDKKVRHR